MAVPLHSKGIGLLLSHLCNVSLQSWQTGFFFFVFFWKIFRTKQLDIEYRQNCKILEQFAEENVREVSEANINECWDHQNSNTCIIVVQ